MLLEHNPNKAYKDHMIRKANNYTKNIRKNRLYKTNLYKANCLVTVKWKEVREWLQGNGLLVWLKS